MLAIEVPHFADQEIRYTLETIFSCIKPLVEISYRSVKENHTKLTCNGKSFTIKNYFFTEDGTADWYKPKNIPTSIKHFKPLPFHKTDLLYFYGNGVQDIEENKIEIHADILSSAFFMLSRWEEKIEGSLDIHGRFEASNSIAVRHNFIKRPIVNEYALYMRHLLEWMGIDQFGEKKPKIQITFDIDYIYKWKSIKNLFGALWRNGLDLQQSFRDKISYFESLFDKTKDPYFTFAYIISVLEKNKTKAVFYFKAEDYKSQYDNADYLPNDEIIQKNISFIKEKGHVIGLHPSYESWCNSQLIDKEKKMLENASGNEKIIHVRQHFLRVKFPETYEMYDNLGLTLDSSASYTHFVGFRNGICHSFEIYDFIARKKLAIQSTPLVAMMSISRNKSIEDVTAEMHELMILVKKFGGEAMFLWHNSDLDHPKKKKAFESLVSALHAEAT